jgi:hypothetical protein
MRLLPALPELLCEPGSMTARLATKILSWTVIVPLLAAVLLAFTWGRSIGVAVQIIVAFALAAAVLAAVNHAEVVAPRVGEPFGSLVLAVAVTIIDVGLIVTLMISGGLESASLARDTVFAAVMITCNGIVGIALLIGGVRFHVTMFNAEGTGTALATVTTLATLSLVLPTFTLGRPGPEFTPAQLAFCSYRLTRAVRNVRPDADGSAPRLLPSFDIRRRRRGSRRTRTGCTSGPNPDQSQPGVRLCRPASDSPSPRSPSPRFGWMVPSCWDSIPRRCCCRQ